MSVKQHRAEPGRSHRAMGVLVSAVLVVGVVVGGRSVWRAVDDTDPAPVAAPMTSASPAMNLPSPSATKVGPAPRSERCDVRAIEASWKGRNPKNPLAEAAAAIQKSMQVGPRPDPVRSPFEGVFVSALPDYRREVVVVTHYERAGHLDELYAAARDAISGEGDGPRLVPCELGQTYKQQLALAAEVVGRFPALVARGLRPYDVGGQSDLFQYTVGSRGRSAADLRALRAAYADLGARVRVIAYP